MKGTREGFPRDVWPEELSTDRGFRLLRARFDELEDLAPDARAEQLQELAKQAPTLAAELASLFDQAARVKSPLDAPAGNVTARSSIPNIEGYRIGRLLGQGGSSWVFLAEQDLDGIERRVALKLVGGVEADRFLARFEAEKRILAGLEHPGIARLYDAGRTARGDAYLAMEYVEGSDLLSFCESRRASLAERLRLFVRVLGAVGYAHQNLIVHRDLKPANIMVSFAGNPKLLDFGIAALLDPEVGGEGVRSETLLRLLTPAYASPEQIRGERITTATDVYSLGVVLYELLVGQRPHETTTVGEELERGYREVAFVPPSAAARERVARGERTLEPRSLAGDLDAIVGKALRSDPAERYRSVAEFAEDLERYLAGRPVVARPASWWNRAAKAVARHRAASVAITATVLAAAVALGAHIHQLGRERDRADRAAERARREAETSARVADFLTSIFAAANPSEQPDRPLTGIEILERGAASVDSTLAREPEMRARMNALLGGIWAQVGELDRAESLVAPALGELERRLGPNDAATASAQVALAQIRHSQGREDESKDLFEKALAARRIALGPRHAKVGILLGQYGNALKAKGEFSAAREAFQEGLKILAETLGPESAESGKVWGNYGLLLFRTNEWVECARATERSLVILGKVYGRESTRYATTLANLADVRRQQKRYEEALTAAQESFRIFQKNYGPGWKNETIQRNLLGWSYFDLGRFAEAQAEFGRSVEAAFRTRGRHPNAAWPMRGLASVAIEQGQLSEARTQYERALGLRLETRGPSHWEVAQSLGDLADIEGRLGHRDAQESYLRRALTVRREVHDRTHPDLARATALLGEFLCTTRKGADGVEEGQRMIEEAILLSTPTPTTPETQDKAATASARPDPQEIAAWQTALGRCGGSGGR